jgi:tetratricopeptide (TPR) repeat protein
VAAAAAAWGMDELENRWSLGEIATGAELDREYMDKWVDSGNEARSEDHGLDRLRLEFLEATGRVPEAVELAAKSYRTAPGPETGYDLAYAHSIADDWTQARAVSESELARASDPKDRTWLTYQLAAACSQLGDESCVESAIGRLKQEDAEPSLVPFSKGFSAGSRYRHADAVAAFSEAWAQNPDFATAFNIGLANMCMGRPQDARDWFVQAKDQRLSPRQTTAVLAGAAYTHLDDGDGATAWLLGASALSAGGAEANSVEPRIVLALAALAQRDLEEARWQVKEAVRADPSADLLRGRCFARRAEADALRALEAEQRGQSDAAQAAWRAVAAMPSPAYASVARRALAQACLRQDVSTRSAGQ